MSSWVYNSTAYNTMQILVTLFFRIHDAVVEKLPIVDVDDSYLYRKQQALLYTGVQLAPLPPPAPLCQAGRLTAILMLCWQEFPLLPLVSSRYYN